MASSRRVVVKARFVVHGGGKGAPLRAHVGYTPGSRERTGVNLGWSEPSTTCNARKRRPSD